MAKPKPKAMHCTLIVASQVIRQMRQHARSQMKTEVCGVLIGNKRDGAIHVDACIQGVNATQAGTHVTFTQDTWEHVYKIKDKEYPDDRIVGWYHSHPGFGVFLSDHDSFIHKNFFSSPDQIAWVYDPHSDEEGCFTWVGDRLERLERIEIRDGRGGELVETNPRPEPSILEIEDSDGEFVSLYKESVPRQSEERKEPAWLRRVSVIMSHISMLLLGLFIAWYVFPRVVGIPVDPNTGQPLLKFMAPTETNAPAVPSGSSSSDRRKASPEATPKGNDGQRQ